MKVVVTGASSSIGQPLIAALVEHAVDAVAAEFGVPAASVDWITVGDIARVLEMDSSHGVR
jgi:uncharacterized protein YbjT (DUF2867 family)